MTSASLSFPCVSVSRARRAAQDASHHPLIPHNVSLTHPPSLHSIAQLAVSHFSCFCIIRSLVSHPLGILFIILPLAEYSLLASLLSLLLLISLCIATFDSSISSTFRPFWVVSSVHRFLIGLCFLLSFKKCSPPTSLFVMQFF